MKVAVQGCCHGQLDAIYGRIHKLEQEGNYTVDLVLICGDYQAVRTQADLNCMAVPAKHLQMGDYHKYYTGENVAPILTLVIGGNHEASNHFWELYHGGWIAPNIYYLGFGGVVKFNGLRVAGASGIYKSHDYRLGHYETMPYDKSSVRSIYHARQYDISKLMHISSPDIFLSHDWPVSIDQHGNTRDLLRRKPFFKQDVSTNSLGSPPLMDLLRKLRPARWFSAHLHVRFEAEVIHEETIPAAEAPNPDEIRISLDDDEDLTDPSAPPQPQLLSGNPDEIKLDDEEAAVEEVLPTIGNVDEAGRSGAPSTKFLALDKCLPGRQYLEVFDIAAPESHDPPKFTFDTEWLAITRAFHPYLSLTRQQKALPAYEIMQASINESIEWVKKNVSNEDGSEKDIGSVQHFVMTSPGPIPGFKGNRFPAPSWYTNPQTVALCEILGIENKINPPPPSFSSPPPEALPAGSAGPLEVEGDA